MVKLLLPGASRTYYLDIGLAHYMGLIFAQSSVLEFGALGGRSTFFRERGDVWFLLFCGRLGMQLVSL